MLAMNRNQLKTYRCSNWLRAFSALGVLLFSFSAYFLYIENGLSFLTVVAMAMVPLAILAFTDSIVARIEPRADQLLIVHNLKTTRYDQTSVTEVKRDGGFVFVKLDDGDWRKIPDIGRNSQSIFNTILAWQKNA